MFTIYNKEEWSEILKNTPKPSDEIKEYIWHKTRQYTVPVIDITLEDCKEDFKKLQNLNTTSLIKTGDLITRYDYKWDIGTKYIDSCNIGNKSSNYFHQDLRFKCDSINSPSPYRNWNEKKFFFTLLNAAWSLKVKEITSDTLRHCISMRKYIASQFRTSAALAIYDHFQAKDVLDFSSGWGDRMSAAMASSVVESYLGIDPNTLLNEGYDGQIKLHSGDKNIRYINAPAEECLLANTEKECYDLIFTSPPYFIIERYSKDITQSWQRYKKLDKWLEGFLFPVIENSWRLLKSNGHIAINISDVYCNHTINRICDPMNDFISNLPCAKRMENINYRMAKRMNNQSHKDGIFVEPIWIWRKE